jgi:hypothetical protein
VTTKEEGMSRSPRLVCWLATAAVLSGAQPAHARCETKPPPEGLVERCRSKDFTVTETMSTDMRRSALDMALTDWMKSCVVESRAAALVSEAEESVDAIFEKIKDRSGTTTVKILPVYEPLTYQEAGKTCYGVKSVSFRLGTALDAPAMPDAPADPVAEKAKQVQEAATAAEEALKGRQVGNFAGVVRVLKNYYGDDFDDTYYNVRPTQMGFSQSLETPPACFTELDGGKYKCVSEAEALERCERHVVAEMLTYYKERGDRPSAYADALEELAGRIQDGVDYLHQVNHVQPDNPAVCPAVREGIIPKVEALAHGGMRSVYGAGRY